MGPGGAFDEADVPRPPKTRRRPLLSVRSSPRKLITGTPARFFGQLPMVESNTTGPASAPLIDLGPGSIISFLVRSAGGIVLFRRSGTTPRKGPAAPFWPSNLKNAAFLLARCTV